MKRFMALLKKSEGQDAPPPQLLDEAGRLCQHLQRSPACLEKLVTAMAQGRHWKYLCSQLHVIRASVFVHLCKNQYDTACKLLESCSATEKEELVKIWHEIHYRKAMAKRHTQSLTPVQKHRCRKRCPPPASLCPDGVKSRNYPKEVREALRRFAVEVTTKPSRKQLESLAAGTNLPSHHIYNWFANYRRRQRPRPPSLAEDPLVPLGAEDPACQGQPQEEGTRPAAPAAAQPSFPRKSEPFEGGLPGDAGMDQREWPLVTCSLGWEQAAGGGQSSFTSGAFLLQSSIVQSDQPDGVEPLDLHPAEEPPAFHPTAGAALGAEPGFAAMQAKEEPAGTAAGLWVPPPIQPPWGIRPAQQQLVERQHQEARTAPEVVHKGVQCSLWNRDASCQCQGFQSKESPTMWQVLLHLNLANLRTARLLPRLAQRKIGSWRMSRCRGLLGLIHPPLTPSGRPPCSANSP